jgi:hypothetical protein
MRINLKAFLERTPSPMESTRPKDKRLCGLTRSYPVPAMNPKHNMRTQPNSSVAVPGVADQRFVMRDIPGMTVQEHHALSIGVLACCYEHVPAELQKAIAEAFESAKKMGMNIKPEFVTQVRALSA